MKKVTRPKMYIIFDCWYLIWCNIGCRVGRCWRMTRPTSWSVLVTSLRTFGSGGRGLRGTAPPAALLDVPHWTAPLHNVLLTQSRDFPNQSIYLLIIIYKNTNYKYSNLVLTKRKRINRPHRCQRDKYPRQCCLHCQVGSQFFGKKTSSCNQSIRYPRCCPKFTLRYHQSHTHRA